MYTMGNIICWFCEKDNAYGGVSSDPTQRTNDEYSEDLLKHCTYVREVNRRAEEFDLRRHGCQSPRGNRHNMTVDIPPNYNTVSNAIDIPQRRKKRKRIYLP